MEYHVNLFDSNGIVAYDRLAPPCVQGCGAAVLGARDPSP